MSVGASSNTVVLKAIDDEYRDIVRAAQAIYDERMKPERLRLSEARRAWDKAQADHRAAETFHEAERRRNVGEADRRRLELHQAVLRTRPVKIADIETVSVQTRGRRAKVSLPRLRCIEEAAAP